MVKLEIINSVLGFNLKTELKDKEGNILPTGIKKTCITCTDELPKIGTHSDNKKWFTHYNQALLDQIADMKRVNG